MIGSHEVGIIKIVECIYPNANEQFRPSQKYPEYMFDEIAERENVI